MEMGVMRRILKRAKLWHTLSDDIKPLKEPGTIGRALAPKEKSRLVETASLKPEWETAYWAALLALNTTMRWCELRRLRWMDISFDERLLTIRKSKTAAGERVIPLTEEALEVLVLLQTRAALMGPVELVHFVFASFRPVGQFDGKKMLGIRMSDFDPTYR
jgi:integrase